MLHITGRAESLIADGSRKVFVDRLHPTPITSAICCRVAPFSSILRHRSTTTSVITRRRPPTLPCSLAAAKPARVRSTISSLPFPPGAHNVEEKAAGWRRSVNRVGQAAEIHPRACNSDTSVIRSRTLRPSRSISRPPAHHPVATAVMRFNHGRRHSSRWPYPRKTSSHSARISAFSVNRGFDPRSIPSHSQSALSNSQNS